MQELEEGETGNGNVGFVVSEEEVPREEKKEEVLLLSAPIRVRSAVARARLRPSAERAVEWALFARECGLARAGAFTRHASTRRARALELSDEEEVDTVGAHMAAENDGVFSMDLDATEGRYLLAGGMEGSLTAYDTWGESESEAGDSSWPERRASFVGASSSSSSLRDRPSSSSLSLSSSSRYDAVDAVGGGDLRRRLSSQPHMRKIKAVFSLRAPCGGAPRPESARDIEETLDASFAMLAGGHRGRRRRADYGRTIRDIAGAGAGAARLESMERMERLNHREDFAALLERQNARIRSERRAAIQRGTRSNGEAVRASGPGARVDRKLKYHTRCVNSVQWYPVDSGCFVSSGNDRRVVVWDANALDVATDFVFEERVHKSRMSKTMCSHCLIAVALADPGIRLCDMASGACVHTLVGHAKDVLTLAWSPGSEFVLASGGADGSIRFFDIRKPGAYMVLDQHNSRATTLDTSFGVPGSGDRKRARDGGIGGAGGGGLSSGNGARAHNGAVHSLAFTTDGTGLISCGTDGRVRLWDAVTGLNTMVNFAETPKLKKSGEIAVSADSTTMFLPGAWDVGVYDVHSGRQLSPLRGHFDNVNSVLFHPHDEMLFSGAGDSQILVWRAARESVRTMR